MEYFNSENAVYDFLQRCSKLMTIGILLVFVLLIFAVIWDYLFQKPLDIRGCHVLITGGSSGIGKEVAKEALKCGAKVSIVARNKQRLTDVQEELRNNFPNQKVEIVSLDISKTHNSEEENTIQYLQDQLSTVKDLLGPVKVLIHCAGYAYPCRANEIPEKEIRQMVETNLYGTIMLTRALLPDLMADNDQKGGGGAIIFTSSIAGLVGVYGYSAYCATKFAIRGYAEALSYELKPYNIKVSVCCPPDTNTPGFQEEEKTKPEETKLISDSAGLFEPEVVARTLLFQGLKGTFLSSNGLDGWLVTHGTIGMAPSSYKDFLIQFTLLGIFRLILFFSMKQFHRIISKCIEKRRRNKNDATKKEI